jgi:type VI secretion system protein ImpM
MSNLEIGVYGKLPGHGDFVSRHLPSPLLNHWDAWLQAFIGSSQERLGQDWLTIYLTSPIWRFAFSSGVLDERQWLGILLPSVDKVGRYFPFSVLLPVPGDAALVELLSEQNDALSPLEDIALQALDEGFLVEEFLARAQSVALPAYSSRQWRRVSHQPGPMQVDCPSADFGRATPRLLDGLLGTCFSSYSIWTSQGSDRVNACMALTPGLPSSSASTALLDGHWQGWQWMVAQP